MMNTKKPKSSIQFSFLTSAWKSYQFWSWENLLWFIFIKVYWKKMNPLRYSSRICCERYNKNKFKKFYFQSVYGFRSVSENYYFSLPMFRFIVNVSSGLEILLVLMSQFSPFNIQEILNQNQWSRLVTNEFSNCSFRLAKIYKKFINT